MSMIQTLLIDGGLGRTICAIPALEKFVENYPNSYIIVHTWTPILWGNTKIARNVFDEHTKDLYYKIRDTYITKPEPYYNSEYLHGKISLRDAFERVINFDDEPMPIPKIHLSSAELHYAAKNFTPGKKYIAFQPIGSTAKVDDGVILDTTVRSLSVEAINLLGYKLKKRGYTCVLLGNIQLPIDHSNFIYVNTSTAREFAAVISQCDYFIGVDSSGQHIARCFDIPGTVILGGSNPVNISYPDHYNIIQKSETRSYMPYRLCEFDFTKAEIENHALMDFTEKELNDIADNIINHIEKQND